MKKLLRTFLAFLCACVLFTCSAYAIDSPDETDSIPDGLLDSTPELNEEVPRDQMQMSPEAEEAVTFPLSDVSESDWFYKDLMGLYELGIIHGGDDNKFSPDRDISLGEFIKTLVCVLYKDQMQADPPIPTIKESSHWADYYAYFALINGVLELDEYLYDDFDRPITRSQMSRYITLALKIAPSIIESPFFDEADPDSLTLYREYLLFGRESEDGLLCESLSNCTRAEICALLFRILEYTEDMYAYKSAQILKRAEGRILTQEYELWDLFYVINKELYSEFSFRTTVKLADWISLFKTESGMYPDVFLCSSISCSYVEGTKEYLLTLKYNTDIDTLRYYQKVTDRIATAVIEEIIDDTMTDLQKVGAIHDYIIQNCAYDLENYLFNRLPDSSYRSWGVFQQGSAVCQGYCSAFNVLCRKAGIAAHSINGKNRFSGFTSENHCWSIVSVGGVNYYYDLTFNDPVPDDLGAVQREYFELDLSAMLGYGYLFDIESVKPWYFRTPECNSVNA